MSKNQVNRADIWVGPHGVVAMSEEVCVLLKGASKSNPSSADIGDSA